MTPRVIPVGLLTSYIRELLDGDDVLADVWVEGEVTNLFPARSGHVYFTLRDDDRQLKCAMFRAHASRQRVLPENGDQVAAHGHVTLYERDGAVQLYVDVVETAGLGLAALQVERLRQQLAAEGLFDSARKRPLPVAPAVIGVVTSPDGAVWHDIQNVVRRRYPLTRLILAPAAVQGERAAGSLVAAIAALQEDGRAEVVIVARGGGGAEDLAAFNDEAVVRAIFACPVPVVTGVGHETDWTLVDEVADVRAPTPSAAAEVCVPSIAEYAARTVEARERLDAAMMAAGETLRLRLGRRVDRLQRQDPRPRISERQLAVRGLRERAWRGQRAALAVTDARLGASRARLRSLNPASVLSRGYAVLTDGESGLPIGRITETAPGRTMRAALVDGVLVGTVREVQHETVAAERRRS